VAGGDPANVALAGKVLAVEINAPLSSTVTAE